MEFGFSTVKKREKTRNTDPRAEADIAVAAASILARAGFLQGLRRLSEQHQIDLPKGATNVIPTGKRFVQMYGKEALSQVAKLHFKTTLQI